MKNLEEFFNNQSLAVDNFDINDFRDMNDTKRSSNPIFKAFGYPSKIYYPNIQKFIKAYTKENALILDSFCGSGSTGIAALLENRKAVLFDNSPQAINISRNTFLEFKSKDIDEAFKVMKKDLRGLINSLYKTTTTDGFEGYAESIITSNIYSCPSCNNEISLHNSATGKRSEYKCNECEYVLNISTEHDKSRLLRRRIPVEVNIRVEDKGRKKKTEKRAVTPIDVSTWEEMEKDLEGKYGHLWSPKQKIVYNRCYPRVGGWPGFAIDSTVEDLFSSRNVLALKIMNDYIEKNINDSELRVFFKFVFTETLFRVSKRLFVTSGIKTVYHIPPVGKEQNVFTVYERKFKSIFKAKEFLENESEGVPKANIIVKRANSRDLPLPNNSIDYAFIDPPYGGVVPYAELNLFYSAWLNENEDLENEVIIPMDYEKKEEYIVQWGKMIEEAFAEVYRVLKPGSYFTIVFQSRFNSIWNELRDVMINRLGFEFINIVSNERAETFHTNHLNDTNPESAFITYRKPVEINNSNKEFIEVQNILDYFEEDYFVNKRTFREIQSYIINLAHEYHLDKIPSDKELEEILKGYRQLDGRYYM
ncbi:hypothetical protein AB1Z82_004010 [Bacillus cereus]